MLPGLQAIGQWLSEQPLDFLHALGFLRTPLTASGLRQLLSRIDVTVLEESLTCWINDLLANETPPVDLARMALDGKSLRGTWNRFDRAVHLLNVVDQRTECVIHQRLVPGDTNEHKVALEVLKELVLTARVIRMCVRRVSMVPVITRCRRGATSRNWSRRFRANSPQKTQRPPLLPA